MNNFKTKYGYFSDNGDEYIITTPFTPKPWVNVISNGDYGTVISQSGGGFSWLTHSEFNRLNRWHQDLIQDNWGKFFFIKNNSTGEIWSPTWNVIKTPLDSYQCRFGFGYAVFSSVYKNVEIVLTLLVPFNDSLEIWDMRINNKSGKKLDLSVFSYFEWCLGSSSDFHREFHKTFIETEIDAVNNTMLATKRLWEIPLGDRGHWNIEYEYWGFLSCSRKAVAFEGDKENFIGQFGSIEKPRAVVDGKLTNKSGKWNDSIGAMQVDITIGRGDSEQLAFYIGLKKNKSDIPAAINKYKTAEQIDSALADIKLRWENILGTLEIHTPDDAMNLAVNKWFRYQAIAGRLWGRTAYYQQSGAFGFRDQLQDSLVYLPINPGLTKDQIKLHARHQFQDGTVLHWWHPISETGLPTRMTDDLLWLPFLVYNYIEETGDLSILDLEEPFYDNSAPASISDHCDRAINIVLGRLSPRGLTLIGAGDWNDGLSAVGLDFKGESVWLTEFFYLVLLNFARVVERHSDNNKAIFYREKADALKTAFDRHAWDGKWFWRATKDNGQKIGSCENSEGSIFLNAQTWAVISGISDNEKNSTALNSVETHLLKNNGCLLLAPAYSVPDKYIGYLSRYAPGRRENGGVYSHAATWAMWAFGIMKNSSAAWQAYKRLNPILSGMEPDKYAAEPYVMPGNIDGPDSPNYGMAGWTWYTGSASWFAKMCVDWLLGVRAVEDGLMIDPCIPAEWDGFKVKRLFRGCTYSITVVNNDHVSSGISKIVVNGIEQQRNIVLSDDKVEIEVIAYMGKPA